MAKGEKSAPSVVQRIATKIKGDNERAARRAVIEELFYDLNSSRAQIYRMNFFRGLFFGLGSALGATLLVAIAIWLLGWFGGIFPPLADFMNNLTEAMQERR